MRNIIRSRVQSHLSVDCPILVAPSRFLQCFNTLKNIFQSQSARLEKKSHLYEEAIGKYEEIEEQVTKPSL